MLATILALALVVAAPLRLSEVLADVDARAPTVEVGERDVAVAQAAVGTAGVWSDPMLTLSTSGVPLPGRPRPPMGTMIGYGVQQTFDTLGRRRPAKRAAKAEVRAARQRLRRDRWDAKAEAVDVFLQLWAIDALDAIYREQIDVLETAAAAALDIYRAGLPGGHHDVLRAEAEALAVQASLASLADERAAAAAMLNTLRGRPPEDPIDAVVLPTLDPMPSLQALVDRGALTPEGLQARADRQAAAARRRLAHAGYLPMITAGAHYEQRLFGMPDSVGAMVSLTVPLWSFDNQRHQVELADASVRRSEQRIRAAEALAEAEVRVAWSRARAARRRLDVLEDAAIPRMQQTLSASQAEYISGTGSFLGVLDTTLALQGLQEDRIAATVALHASRFEVERVLGGLAPEARR